MTITNGIDLHASCVTRVINKTNVRLFTRQDTRNKMTFLTLWCSNVSAVTRRYAEPSNRIHLSRRKTGTSRPTGKFTVDGRESFKFNLETF